MQPTVLPFSLHTRTARFRAQLLGFPTCRGRQSRFRPSPCFQQIRAVPPPALRSIRDFQAPFCQAFKRLTDAIHDGRNRVRYGFGCRPAPHPTGARAPRQLVSRHVSRVCPSASCGQSSTPRIVQGRKTNRHPAHSWRRVPSGIPFAGPPAGSSMDPVKTLSLEMPGRLAAFSAVSKDTGNCL